MTGHRLFRIEWLLGVREILFASETSETKAACEPADVVRVRVGVLHFNFPKERQVKLASARKQLVFLALFGLVPDKRHIFQKLNHQGNPRVMQRSHKYK